MASIAASLSRGRVITLWVLRMLMAALFLFAASRKLVGDPSMVAEFGKVGFGQWFRYAVGLLEVAGAVLVLVPRTTWIGAAVLLFVDVGAFFAQVATLHMDWIHTVVVGTTLVTLMHLSRRWTR